MRTHCIYLGSMTGRQMLTPGSYEGEQIVLCEAPIYDAARWLLEHGRAHPDDRIETWRGDMMCLSGRVGTLAQMDRRRERRGWTADEAMGRCPGRPRPACRPKSVPIFTLDRALARDAVAAV